MNFIEELGIMALGSRIKNLGELLMKDVSRIYKEQGFDFEPRWFTFYQLILERKEVSVTEIARELNQTHPAAVQVINSLEKKRLITSRKDNQDQRKRLVRLTAKGKKLAEKLGPVWEAIHTSAREILAESDKDLIEHMASVEDAIRQKSPYKRVTEKLNKDTNNEFAFIPYEEKYKKDFRQLNEEWLSAYLEITDHDQEILSDPIKKIIKNKGQIHLLLKGGKVIGTYALQKTGDHRCELSKFTISKDFRGRKLGERMLVHAIDQARNMKCKAIVLFTHHALREATQLYKKIGFEVIADHPGLIDKTGRCSLYMQLIIHQ